MSLTRSAVKSTMSALACAVALLPSQKAQAQAGAVRHAANWLFDIPRWSVDVHAGIGNYGRFLLQNPDGFEEFRERELRGLGAWTFGAGVGAMPLPRVGFRLGLSHASADLDWRDDTGTGTDLLDFDDLANLSQWLISAEFIRYLLPETVRFTPYGAAGILATWWSLDDTRISIIDDTRFSILGEDTHFRWGGTATVGLQFRLSRSFRARLEAVTASIGNPFSGNNSFIALDGRTIDEPSRVRKTDFRLDLAYVWGRPHRAEATDGDNGGHKRRR